MWLSYLAFVHSTGGSMTFTHSNFRITDQRLHSTLRIDVGRGRRALGFLAIFIFHFQLAEFKTPDEGRRNVAWRSLKILGAFVTSFMIV
ncbi:hypothetical protein AB1N83_010907 [Pleurotus pulmonarius]